MPNPRYRKQINRYGSTILSFILITSFLALPSSIHSQDVLKIVDTLEKVLPDKEKEKESYRKWMDEFKLAGKFIKEMEAERRDLKLELAAGFNGNRAGENNNFHKLDVAAKIRRGGYPHQLRFVAETSVLYEDNSLREDVRTMLINYDYHVLPSLETFGFVERFSNSYMSIKQRYEIGIGIKYELELLGLVKKKCEVDSFEEKSKTYSKLENYIKNTLSKKKPDADIKPLLEQVIELKKEAQDILNYTKKEYSKLELGMATSLFVELEQAELETEIADPNMDEDTEVTISTEKFHESDQFLRWSIRPSLLYRPTEFLVLEGLVYWKYRLDDPVRQNGDLDFRRDLILKATLAMPKTAGWADKASLTFEYRQQYDNIPPSLSIDVVNSYLEEGRILSPITAQKWHHQFKFMINLKF
jgi:hypothetical protein